MPVRVESHFSLDSERILVVMARRILRSLSGYLSLAWSRVRPSEAQFDYWIGLFSLRKLPPVATALIVLSWICYGLNRVSFDELLNSALKDSTGQIIVFLLHPIVHMDLNHLFQNFLGIFISGSLIELSMTDLKRIVRYGMLTYCYLVSLAVSYLEWAKPSEFIDFPNLFPVGLSGIIFAALPFALFHYLSFPSRMRAKNLHALGPIGIGFLLGALMFPFLSVLYERGLNLALLPRPAFLHLYAFLPSAVLAYLLFVVLRPRRIFQSDTRTRARESQET